MTLGTNMNFTYSGGIHFLATSGSFDINTNGIILPTEVWFGLGSSSAVWTLQGDFETSFEAGLSSAVLFYYGTFDANDFNVTVNNLNIYTGFTLVMGNGIWELNGPITSYCWEASTTSNITPEGSTIKITKGNPQVFRGGSKTYNNIQLASTSSFATYWFSGSNTFNSFIDTDTNSHYITFSSGTTTTVTNFNVVGTPTNFITISGHTTSTYTLTKAGSGTIECDYLDISYSSVGPSNTWYAGLNSIDSGNNSGWLFYGTPRFWVGGSDNWNTTSASKWAMTSGGVGGASYPTVANPVIFDSNSGANTVTITTSVACYNLDSTGFIGTLAGSTALEVKGSLTFVSGMTLSYTGDITFSSLIAGQTITSGTKSFLSNIIMNGVGGAWTLQDELITSKNITLTNGTFSTNNKNFTCFLFSSSNSNTRTVNLGSSTILANWYIPTSTNLTLNAGTSNITTNSSIAGTGSIFSGGNKTYNIVTIKPGGGGVTHSMSGSNTFATFTITGTNSRSCIFSISGNQTVTGTLTMNGINNIARLFLYSSIPGTVRTLTAATVSASYLDLQDINGAGVGNWDLSTITGGSGDLLGNTNITFTTPVTRYWVANSGGLWDLTSSWSDSSNGAPGSSIPLPQDTVIFDNYSITSESSIINLNHQTTGANLDFTSVLNNPIITISNVSPIGVKIRSSLKLITGMTVTTGTYGLSFISRSNVDFTTADIVMNIPLRIEAPGATIRQIGNLTTGSTKTLYIITGTYDLNDYNSVLGKVDINWSTTREIKLGSGTMELNGTGVVWQASTSNLTVTPSTSTIKITDNSSTSKLFYGSSKTYNNIWLTGIGSGYYYIAAGNTFNDFKDDNSNAHTIYFDAGTTNTFTTFNVKGGALHYINIRSLTNATHTLVKAGGGIIACDYLMIQYSIASPATTWYAGPHSMNFGNNTGWFFGGPPFTDPGNIYADDGSYSTVSSPDGVLNVSISGNGGTSYSSVLSKTFGAGETLETYGNGTTELWGGSWLGSQMNDTNFRVKLSVNDTNLSQNIYKTFGFTPPTNAMMLGIEISVSAKWDGSILSADLLEVRLYYGGSVLPVQPGSQAYASNGRKAGEGAGAGSGVLVYYDGNDWIASDTGLPVQP